MLFGKRLERMEESRLVKMVFEKLGEDGGRYEVLMRKFDLDNECGLIVNFKNMIMARYEDCIEMV